MLYLLASLLFAGAAAQCSGTGKTQSGNNYVIDSFTTSNLLFTYAINQCTAVSLLDSSVFYKYTCMQDTNDVWWVTKSAYTSSDCSGTASASLTWNDSVATAGNAGYFKCDGKDSYAAIQISIDEQCAGAITIAGGLGGCASNPAVYDTKFYCDATSAAVQLYVNPSTINSTYAMCDDSHLYCTSWSFTSSCSYVTTLFGQSVYGTFSKCEVMTDSESSASSQFTLLGLVVALVVGLFH